MAPIEPPTCTSGYREAAATAAAKVAVRVATKEAGAGASTKTSVEMPASSATAAPTKPVLVKEAEFTAAAVETAAQAARRAAIAARAVAGKARMIAVGSVASGEAARVAADMAVAAVQAASAMAEPRPPLGYAALSGQASRQVAVPVKAASPISACVPALDGLPNLGGRKPYQAGGPPTLAVGKPTCMCPAAHACITQQHPRQPREKVGSPTCRLPAVAPAMSHSHAASTEAHRPNTVGSSCMTHVTSSYSNEGAEALSTPAAVNEGFTAAAAPRVHVAPSLPPATAAASPTNTSTVPSVPPPTTTSGLDEAAAPRAHVAPSLPPATAAASPTNTSTVPSAPPPTTTSGLDDRPDPSKHIDGGLGEGISRVGRPSRHVPAGFAPVGIQPISVLELRAKLRSTFGNNDSFAGDGADDSAAGSSYSGGVDGSGGNGTSRGGRLRESRGGSSRLLAEREEEARREEAVRTERAKAQAEAAEAVQAAQAARAQPVKVAQQKTEEQQGKVVVQQSKVVEQQSKVVVQQGKVVEQQGRVAQQQGKVMESVAAPAMAPASALADTSATAPAICPTAPASATPSAAASIAEGTETCGANVHVGDRTPLQTQETPTSTSAPPLPSLRNVVDPAPLAPPVQPPYSHADSEKYRQWYERTLKDERGWVSREAAWQTLARARLPAGEQELILTLCDVDADGFLDEEEVPARAFPAFPRCPPLPQSSHMRSRPALPCATVLKFAFCPAPPQFCLALHLTTERFNGHGLPSGLQAAWLSPSKRQQLGGDGTSEAEGSERALPQTQVGPAQVQTQAQAQAHTHKHAHTHGQEVQTYGAAFTARVNATPAMASACGDQLYQSGMPSPGAGPGARRFTAAHRAEIPSPASRSSNGVARSSSFGRVMSRLTRRRRSPSDPSTDDS